MRQDQVIGAACYHHDPGLISLAFFLDLREEWAEIGLPDIEDLWETLQSLLDQRSRSLSFGLLGSFRFCPLFHLSALSQKTQNLRQLGKAS